MNYLIRMIITALAIMVCSYFMPEGIYVNGFFTAFVVAIVLSFLNTFIKPLLILLTIPITIFTLGIFLLFINAIIIYFADVLIEGFRVTNLWWAIGLSILLSFVNSSINARVGKKPED